MQVRQYSYNALPQPVVQATVTKKPKEQRDSKTDDMVKSMVNLEKQKQLLHDAVASQQRKSKVVFKQKVTAPKIVTPGSGIPDLSSVDPSMRHFGLPSQDRENDKKEGKK